VVTAKLLNVEADVTHQTPLFHVGLHSTGLPNRTDRRSA